MVSGHVLQELVDDVGAVLVLDRATGYGAAEPGGERGAEGLGLDGELVPPFGAGDPVARDEVRDEVVPAVEAAAEQVGTQELVPVLVPVAVGANPDLVQDVTLLHVPHRLAMLGELLAAHEAWDGPRGVSSCSCLYLEQ